MIEKLPCHDEIVYEIQRAIQTFGPLTAQSLMKRRAQVTASNECEFSEEYFNFTCAEMQKRRLLTHSKSGAIVSLDGELQKKRDKQARKELKGEILVAQVAYGTDFIPQLFLEKP